MDRLSIREKDQNYTFYRIIRVFEIKEALKRMDNSKVVKPSNVLIKVWKCLGGKDKIDHKIVQ